MLKQMRRRVILAAMLAFAAVIMLIAVLVNTINYFVVTGMTDRTLEAIMNIEKRNTDPQMNGQKGDNPPMMPFMIMPDVESNYMNRFFVVRIDPDGGETSVSTDFIASVDDEDALKYADKAMAKSSESGFVREYRYLREDTGDSTVIIFLNSTRDIRSMKALMVLTLAVSGISLILVFILVVLLSGRAIRPIANNIRQQKQFITDASHELKTPLTSISTSLDVICMEHGEDEWTENIKKQTGRMSKLVSELVTLSRLDEDMPLPNKEQFSLSNAAWEIAEVYQPQAKAQGKSMTVDISENITMVGEKPAIQQMLSVLLDNSIRYSDPNGEIRFSVGKKKNRINIEVFNTCHFDVVPDVNRLFDRFYRPDSSRDSKTGGTGIGLAIAKAVALTHGGTISASCPSGNTMTITIRF